jgi:hypothetical protein
MESGSLQSQKLDQAPGNALEYNDISHHIQLQLMDRAIRRLKVAAA